jgi:hypothetical protein
MEHIPWEAAGPNPDKSGWLVENRRQFEQRTAEQAAGNKAE